MTQRRSCPRLLDSELVTISWRENLVDLTQLGNVRDISLDGLGVVVDYPLPMGTQVTIFYGEGELTGFTRHHSEGISGHLLGIELIGPVEDRCYTMLSTVDLRDSVEHRGP